MTMLLETIAPEDREWEELADNEAVRAHHYNALAGHLAGWAGYGKQTRLTDFDSSSEASVVIDATLALDVTGRVDIAGNVFIVGDADIDGDLDVSGSGDFGVDLIVGNDISVGRDGSIGRDLSIIRDIAVGRNIVTHGNSTLGDAGTDTHQLNGVVTISNGLVIQAAGAAITGDSSVVGDLTVRSATATETALFAESATGAQFVRVGTAASPLVYADVANGRFLIGASPTALLPSAANDKLQIFGGRSYFAPNGELFAIGLRYNNLVTGSFFIGSSNSNTPDAVFSKSDETQVGRWLNSGTLIVGTATAALGSEKLRVQGSAHVAGVLIVTSGITIDASGLTVSAGGADVTGNSRFRNDVQIDGTLTATLAAASVNTSSGFTISGGVLTLPTGGSASAPVLTFAGDTNHGIYRSAADTFEIVTAGVRAIQVNASQEIGLGSTGQTGFRLYIAGNVRWDGTTATTATAGGASALPALPASYLVFNNAGNTFKIPFYNN